LKSVLDDTKELPNFIKTRARNARIVGAHCEEICRINNFLMTHAEIWWLLRGKVLGLFQLKDEIFVLVSIQTFHKASCVPSPILL
jgi:hypothetical protein